MVYPLVTTQGKKKQTNEQCSAVQNVKKMRSEASPKTQLASDSLDTTPRKAPYLQRAERWANGITSVGRSFRIMATTSESLSRLASEHQKRPSSSSRILIHAAGCASEILGGLHLGVLLYVATVCWHGWCGWKPLLRRSAMCCIVTIRPVSRCGERIFSSSKTLMALLCVIFGRCERRRLGGRTVHSAGRSCR